MYKVTAKNYQSLGDGSYSAGEGLLLRVRGNSRTWLYRYQLNGKRRDVTIGNTIELTYFDARKIAEKFSRLKSEGVDVQGYVRALNEEADALEEKANKRRVTFGEYWEFAVDRIATVKLWKNEKHKAQWYSTVETYAVPVLGDLAVEDIKKEHILKVLEPIWSTKTETATRLRSRLEAIFYQAMNDDLIDANPASWRGRLEAYLPPASRVATVKHHERLTLEQTQRLVASLAPFENVSSQAMVFGLLTATRPGEWVGAKWDEIDFASRVWTLPESRMKAGREHRVPLSRKAISILLKAKASGPASDSGYVFVSKWSKSKMSLDTPRLLLQRQTGTKATAHGFRSTFRDWCERSGVPFALSEKALAHAHQSQVVQAYQRDDLLEGRRELMETWAEVVFKKVEA